MSEISPKTGLIHCAATHPGHRRSHNEDAYSVDMELGLYLVADGMGGHEAGEVASRIVAEQVAASLRQGETLTRAVEDAHQAILRGAAAGEGRPGMGTTVVGARFKADAYEVVWVGDSRAYRFGGALERLTQDHSLVQELVQAGRLTEAEARTHPDRSLITRALGMPDLEHLGIDRTMGRLNPGERLLLCSDGLTEELEESEIEELLRTHSDPQAAVQALIDRALEAGGRDNVTVAIVQAPLRRGGSIAAMNWWAGALFGLAALLAVWLFWRLWP